VTLRAELGDSEGLRILWLPLVTALPAGLLRRRPMPALLLMLAGLFAVAATLGSGDASSVTRLAVDVAVGFIAATHPARISFVAAVTTLAVQIGSMHAWEMVHQSGSSWAILQRQPNDVGANLLNAMAIGIALMIGLLMRQRRDSREALRRQAAAQAVTSERLRIARELHDMVAHSIGIIALQAGAASRVFDTQPARARNALSEVEAASRETLSGLRRMLGALRHSEMESASAAASLDPMPGLADIDRLAAATTAAGVHVDVRWSGVRPPLPAEIDASAFRIIQESITNVVRHAGARSCRVSIDCQDEELSIEVLDNGRGRAGRAGTGFGLVGMRERVALLHGEFSAEPRPEGGFRVTARLPVPAGVR
jgi:signal transduction histidine kinase